MHNQEPVYLIGERYRAELQPGLTRLGIKVLWLPDNLNLAQPVRGHADLSVLAAPDKTIFLAPYLKYTDIPKQLEESGFNVCIADIHQRPDYPADVQLSICQIGNKYLVNPDTVCNSIVREKYAQMQRIECRQGYTRCSVFVINESSVITSDDGIYKILINNGLNVLKIKSGNILLPGYDYGFIGGAGFMRDSAHAVFSGILQDKSDCMNMENYFAERSIEIQYLTDGPMFDFGGSIRI